MYSKYVSHSWSSSFHWPVCKRSRQACLTWRKSNYWYFLALSLLLNKWIKSKIQVRKFFYIEKVSKTITILSLNFIWKQVLFQFTFFLSLMYISGENWCVCTWLCLYMPIFITSWSFVPLFSSCAGCFYSILLIYTIHSLNASSIKDLHYHVGLNVWTRARGGWQPVLNCTSFKYESQIWGSNGLLQFIS